MKITERALSGIKPYSNNPRNIPEAAVVKVARSIKEFGFRQPLVVDVDGVIIVGHTRYLAAKTLGIKRVPVHVMDATDEHVRAYRIADNRLGEISNWDDAALVEELESLDGMLDTTLTGFDMGELQAMLSPTEDAAPDGEDSADEYTDPPADPITRAGDMWLLGDHRLFCGDSTDDASVGRLMGGDEASLLFTSPPYGNQRDYTSGGVGDWDALMNGALCDLPMMADDGQVLVNLGMIHRDNEWRPYWDSWCESMQGRGWRRFGLYVWDQGPGMPGDWNGRLAPAFEFIFHFNRDARRVNKIVPCLTAGQVSHGVGDTGGGMRGKDGVVNDWTHSGAPTQEMKIPDSVIRTTRHSGRSGHPAVFPVSCPRSSWRRAAVQETWFMSRSAARAPRSSRAKERAGMCGPWRLRPEYVDVALAQWATLFPGQAATLEDGRTFTDVAAERATKDTHK